LVTIGPNGTALEAGQQQPGANHQTAAKVTADTPDYCVDIANPGEQGAEDDATEALARCGYRRRLSGVNYLVRRIAASNMLLVLTRCLTQFATRRIVRRGQNNHTPSHSVAAETLARLTSVLDLSMSKTWAPPDSNFVSRAV
jgi:hypothetical protein